MKVHQFSSCLSCTTTCCYHDGRWADRALPILLLGLKPGRDQILSEFWSGPCPPLSLTWGPLAFLCPQPHQPHFSVKNSPKFPPTTRRNALHLTPSSVSFRSQVQPCSSGNPSCPLLSRSGTGSSFTSRYTHRPFVQSTNSVSNSTFMGVIA